MLYIPGILTSYPSANSIETQHMVGTGKTNTKENSDKIPQPYSENIFISRNDKDVWAWTEKKKEQQIFVTAQRHLFVIRGVSFDAVSHEESVRAGGDEGMTRSHNLKAQETECTQQGC